MTDCAWRSAYIYYHDDDKTGLLLDAVRPTLQELADVIDAAYVLRHWRQGPHLRLNIRTDPAEWTTLVRPAIEKKIGGYLAEQPSTTKLDPDSRIAEHRILADRERDDGPLTPWLPNNSLSYPPYESRLAVLGDQAAVDLLTDFHVETNPLMFDILSHVRSGFDTMPLLSVGLMVTTAHVGLGPISRGFGSFRAHADGFLASCRDPDKVRTAFDESYHANRETLVDRVRHVVDTVEGTAPSPLPFVSEWAALITQYSRLAEAVVDGPALPRSTESWRERLNDPHASEYLKLAASSRNYVHKVLNGKRFLRFRVVLNQTYFYMTRLGLTPVNRYLLCHLVANAVEDAYSVSAINLMRRTVEKVDR
jgi:hypothetical protein